METLGNAILQNSAKKYYCKKCDYGTCRKSSYDDHLISRKHKINVNGNQMETNGNNNLQKICNSQYSCINCNKEFKNRSGLWKHKKNCNSNNIITDKELMMALIKDSGELKTMIMKVIENGTNNYTSTNTNSHNKTFNLQLFLNETCKDAMNISEFIENISLQLSDLENMGKLGYVEGVSNIIIKNLNALEVEKRPMHCTDKKREIMYVKDDDEWQKEQDDKKHIKSVIGSVVSKNLELLTEYENKYPECMNPESKRSDEYNKIIMETMGGGMNVGEKNKEKIIRRIAKEVIIDKE